MNEFGNNSVIDQETIRSVVIAYAEEKIELERPTSAKARNTRYAPSFRIEFAFNDDKRKPYNAESIAQFLGWWSGDQVSPRVRNALYILEQAEEMQAPEEIREITTPFSITQGAASQGARCLNAMTAFRTRGDMLLVNNISTPKS